MRRMANARRRARIRLGAGCEVIRACQLDSELSTLARKHSA